MARFFVALLCALLLGACDGGGDGNGDGGFSGSGAGFGSGFGGSGGGNGGASGGGSGAMCPSFSPCGGSIDGTWSVQDICIEDALSLAGTATDEPACSDLFRSIQTGGSGTITFQGGTVTSNARLTIEMHAVWTVPCLIATSGVQDVDLATACIRIGETYAMNPELASSSCTRVDQTCDCTVELEQDFALPTRYTTDGSKITFEGDSSVTTYCVSGSTLSIRNMDSSSSGTMTLTR